MFSCYIYGICSAVINNFTYAIDITGFVISKAYIQLLYLLYMFSWYIYDICSAVIFMAYVQLLYL